MRNILKQNLFQNPVLKDIAWIASIAVIYFIVGNLSMELLFEPEGIAAIWPNSGIFLSALLLTRRKLLPYLIGTLFITDLIIEMIAGSPFNVSFVYAFALTFDASLSAWLLTRFTGGQVTFDRVKHVFGFISLSVILSNALAATIASMAAYMFIGESFWNSWALWWSSDAVGNLLITPFVLSLASMNMARLWKSDIKRTAEAVLFFVSIITINFFALQRFGGNIDLFSVINYLTFPFLIWAAIRFGIRGVTFASVVLTANILYFILRSQILPLSGSLLNSVIMVQLYIAIISASSLILASVYTERRQAEQELQIALIKYKTLFYAFPLGITVADQTGNIMESNPMAERLLGLSQEEHLQRKIDGKEWSIVRPDGTPLDVREYASVRALRENRLVENMEMGILKAGGEITWI
ncbi:MAG: MASE1 domain-containing protein, partial [Candidatus Methanoperedens sp.]